MRYNKVYFPVDALSKREDFDMWYADGEVFGHVTCDWKTEHDKVHIIGRMGGEMAWIKPDNKSLNYDIRVERYTYILHTYTIFHHYYIEGMLWRARGNLLKMPLHFINENNGKKDVSVKLVEFRDKGKCYEVRAADLSNLRPAVCSILAIAWKEEWRGLSEGEIDENASTWKKLKRWWGEPGTPFDQILTDEQKQAVEEGKKKLKEISLKGIRQLKR